VDAPGSGVEPLGLFRTLAVHPELMSRMRPLGAGLLGHPTVQPLEREIVIHRISIRAGADYEWGVHAVALAPAVGLSDEQIVATAVSGADDPAWSELDALLIRLADELHETATVSDALWDLVTSEWSPSQLLELVVLAGWYRLLAGVINAARVAPESWVRPRPR
jgi:4-carboxymuconolactone decarboxylase